MPRGESWRVWREEVARLWRLAVPVMVAQLGMMAMGFVDTVLVGPLGSEALAATSAANAIFFSFLIFFMGTLTILNPMISQAVGAEQSSRAGTLMWQGIWLGLLFGIPLNLMFFDCRWALALLDQPPAVVELAGQYLGARSFASVPFMLFVAGRNFLNGIGDTKPIMIVVLLANVVNAAADYVLIYGKLGVPPLGVLGAGLATAIVRWVMALGLAWWVARPRYRTCNVAWHRPDRAVMWRITRLGLPVGSQMFAEVAVFGAAAVLSGWLGAQAQAAHQIALTLASITFMIPLGMSIAASIRVGQAVGRQDYAAAARAGRAAFALGGSMMAVCGICFLALPGLLASLFSPEPAVWVTAVVLIQIAALFQVSDGVQIVGQGCLRGAGDTRTALIANLVAHWLVGLPLGYLLAFRFGLGVTGIWWGLTASLSLVAVLLAVVFWRGRWRTLERLIDSEPRSEPSEQGSGINSRLTETSKNFISEPS